ncbi:hypothetical protein ACIRD6_39080 [Streptomyces sp. NPDC102473]
MHTRVTGIVIEDDKILVLNQDTDGPRTWFCLAARSRTARLWKRR